MTALVVLRLAWRNVRHRWWQALLLLFALCLATTSLGLALAINGTGDAAWYRVWRATNGAHVQAQTMAGLGNDPAELAAGRQQLLDLTRQPGVVAAGPPTPQLFTSGTIASTATDVLVLVRDPAPAAVGQPLVTAGQWLDGGDSVVLEDGFARALHVRPGDTVTVAGLSLPVRGTAMTVSRGRYPLYQPGIVWVDPAVADRMRAAGARDASTFIELRLSDPAAAPAFVAAYSTGPTVQIGLQEWQDMRDSSHNELTTFAVALLAVGTMLAGLTIATAAVLVAGRMAAQIRQVGTLKALGVTPMQVTAVLLVEYVGLAAIAAIVGVVGGTLAAPLLVRGAPSLYGPAQAPGLTGLEIAVVAGVALVVVVVATARPALRGVRYSTVRALATTARAPRRASRLAGLGGRLGLPLPTVLGIRTALRRPARTVLNAAGLALAMALVVVSLALHDGVDRVLAAERATGEGGTSAVEQDLIHQLLAIVYTAMALLLALAVINAVIVAVFAARDVARNHAILRAVGATPRQTTVAFVVAQLGACLIACVIGIPFGVAVFDALRGSLPRVDLPIATYIGIVAAALCCYALTAIVPARLLARRSVTERLAYE